MKQTLLYSLLLTGSLYAQNVNIPDPIFKAYLLGQTTINTNMDMEIQETEAVAYTGSIDCNGMNISDLTGIEAFTSLTQLFCHNNNLSTLNVSANSALIVLKCHLNDITGLDLSANQNLELLDCGSNLLSALDVSNNLSLVSLYCGGNQITTLDLSNNYQLTAVYANNNALTTMNMANGSNTNLVAFWTVNNPNLNCIKVDDASYSTMNWTSGSFLFDNGVTFDENCIGAKLNELNSSTMIHLFPNPASSELNVMLANEEMIEIIDVSGNVVMQSASSISHTIGVAHLNEGVYFVRTHSGYTAKFTKF